MRNLFITLSIAVSVISCTQNKAENPQGEPRMVESRLNKMSWLLGTWSQDMPETVFTESWEKSDQNEWKGRGMLIGKGGDTLFAEQLRLLSDNDTIWYLPRIHSQNGGEEVKFRNTTLTDSLLVFENPGHDFPQRIVYQKTSDTSIVAYIEGLRRGKMQKEEFILVKK